MKIAPKAREFFWGVLSKNSRKFDFFRITPPPFEFGVSANYGGGYLISTELSQHGSGKVGALIKSIL